MLLALLGDPVDHSLSPAIHRAAMAHVGIHGRYEARRTDRAGVTAAVQELRTGELDGANVTMPLKSVALDAADSASVEAVRSGAVNTLVLRDGAVLGENTDIRGVSDVWDHRQLPPGPVLILGAGGAAGAALVALEGRSLHVAARRPDFAAALVTRAGADAEIVPWGTPIAAAVVVNATPLGMRGEDLPASVLAAASGLLDMTYRREPTPAAAWADGRIPVADGLDLLVSQAARSFTHWTGLTAPRDVMEAAARGR